jgi:ribosome-associated protein
LTKEPKSGNITLDAVRVVMEAADEKQAENTVVLDMRETFPITDYFIVTGADNPRKIKAISRNIEDRLLEKKGMKPFLKEGSEDTGWMLLDYLDFVVHIFRNEEREFYRLEQLWQDAPAVKLTDGS